MGYTVYGKVNTFEKFEELIGEELTQEDKMEDAMIRASIKAGLGRQQLINTKINEGLIGVYLLGMKHMYEYLEDKL